MCIHKTLHIFKLVHYIKHVWFASGLYASYWNAGLFSSGLVQLILPEYDRGMNTFPCPFFAGVPKADTVPSDTRARGEGGTAVPGVRESHRVHLTERVLYIVIHREPNLLPHRYSFYRKNLKSIRVLFENFFLTFVQETYDIK